MHEPESDGHDVCDEGESKSRLARLLDFLEDDVHWMFPELYTLIGYCFVANVLTWMIAWLQGPAFRNTTIMFLVLFHSPAALLSVFALLFSHPRRLQIQMKWGRIKAFFVDSTIVGMSILISLFVVTYVL